MISYLIASYRRDPVKETIKSIQKLPSHDYEIVVSTPYPENDYDNVRYILDDKKNGSTYAFNKGTTHCNGDWIVVGIDDHIINYDVYSFLGTIKKPEIEGSEYQVINLGSPWTDCIARNASGYEIDMSGVSPDIMSFRWPVITFPAVSKKTIETKLDGYLFHPDLLHHFVDHWIGLYVSVKQQSYNFNQCGNQAAWLQHLPGDNCDRSQDDKDSVTFCKLAARFIQNPTNYNYTTSL